MDQKEKSVLPANGQVGLSATVPPIAPLPISKMTGQNYPLSCELLLASDTLARWLPL